MATGSPGFILQRMTCKSRNSCPRRHSSCLTWFVGISLCNTRILLSQAYCNTVVVAVVRSRANAIGLYWYVLCKFVVCITCRELVDCTIYNKLPSAYVQCTSTRNCTALVHTSAVQQN